MISMNHSVFRTAFHTRGSLNRKCSQLRRPTHSGVDTRLKRVNEK